MSDHSPTRHSPVLRPDAELYPDVAAAGGDLVSALRQTADLMGVQLVGVRGTKSPTDSCRLVVASFEASRGPVGVTLQQKHRELVLRIWMTGVGEAATGGVQDLETVVNVAGAWQAGNSLTELASRWPFLDVDPLALAHEQGRAVAFAWQRARDLPDRLVDHGLLEAAFAVPVLRGLFPMVTHGSLQFSRCTRFPYSGDVPSIFPLQGGGWRVTSLWDPQIAHRDVATAEEAVVVVAAALPNDCAPAVEGDADALRPGA